jgi:hypothetical protein
VLSDIVGPYFTEAESFGAETNAATTEEGIDEPEAWPGTDSVNLGDLPEDRREKFTLASGVRR